MIPTDTKDLPLAILVDDASPDPEVGYYVRYVHCVNCIHIARCHIKQGTTCAVALRSIYCPICKCLIS